MCPTENKETQLFPAPRRSFHGHLTHVYVGFSRDFLTLDELLRNQTCESTVVRSSQKILVAHADYGQFIAFIEL